MCIYVYIPHDLDLVEPALHGVDLLRGDGADAHGQLVVVLHDEGHVLSGS